jgi:hypothetical protein
MVNYNNGTDFFGTWYLIVYGKNHMKLEGILYHSNLNL